MFVKICGMTTPEAIAAAAEAGADAVGFVFAPSPREVSPERAVALCRELPASILRVAVMRHPPIETWRRVLDVFGPDWLQTDAEDLEGIAVPPGCQALPVYRNGSLPAPDALPARLVFEGTVSGSGETADWDEARRVAARTQLILAGGLTPENVGDAIEVVEPWGVDVSSGVERHRGEKDPAKIKVFVARARAQKET
jgi:phosphoribosylanthranilate isomerase